MRESASDGLTLTAEEILRDRRSGRDDVETVKSAGHHVHLAVDPCRAQPLGVVAVFGGEQVQGADPDPRGRQSREVGTPRRDGLLGTRAAEVARPPEAVGRGVESPRARLIEFPSLQERNLRPRRIS